MATIQNVIIDQDRIKVFVSFEGKEEVFAFMPEVSKDDIIAKITERKKELEAESLKLAVVEKELTKLIGTEI